MPKRKRKNFIIVGKDKFTTRFMQDADMFEKFKFLGHTFEASGEFTEKPAEVLRRLHEKENEKFQVVGLIIPNETAVFVKGHTVFSKGTHWALISDMAKAYGVDKVDEIDVLLPVS